MNGWKEEHCSEQPNEVQVIGGGMVIVRRDVQRVDHEAADKMPAYTEWICESRIMPEKDYQMLQSIEEIDNTKAIDAYTMQLIEEGIL